MDHWRIEKERSEDPDERTSWIFVLSMDTIVSIEASSMLAVIIEEPGMNWMKTFNSFEIYGLTKETY